MPRHRYDIMTEIIGHLEEAQRLLHTLPKYARREADTIILAEYIDRAIERAWDTQR